MKPLLTAFALAQLVIGALLWLAPGFVLLLLATALLAWLLRVEKEATPA